MAKKTLSISVTEKQYGVMYEHLNAYNTKKHLSEKITCSKFLFKLVALALKVYHINNNSFEKSHEFLNTIIEKKEQKQVKKEHEGMLKSENIIEVDNPIQNIKARLGLKFK